MNDAIAGLDICGNQFWFFVVGIPTTFLIEPIAVVVVVVSSSSISSIRLRRGTKGTGGFPIDHLC